MYLWAMIFCDRRVKGSKRFRLGHWSPFFSFSTHFFMTKFYLNNSLSISLFFTYTWNTTFFKKNSMHLIIKSTRVNLRNREDSTVERKIILIFCVVHCFTVCCNTFSFHNKEKKNEIIFLDKRHLLFSLKWVGNRNAWSLSLSLTEIQGARNPLY